VNERGEQRVEEPEGSEADADAVDDKRADEILQDGATAATGGVEGVDELGEIAADEDNVGAFAGHVGARAHGDADGGLHQGRSIVDPVADHGGFVAFLAELLHVLRFIFGEKFGGDFVDG